MKLTVGSLLRGGLGVLRSHRHSLTVWIAIQAALSIVLYLAMRPLVPAMIAAQQQNLAAMAAGNGAPHGLPPGFGLFIALELVFLLWILMLFTAVVRATSNPQEDRFGWVRLGMDELRLIGLGLLFLIAFVLAEIATVIVGVLLIGLGTLAGKPVGLAIAVIYVIALLCALIWVEVRLSLVSAVTVLRGKIIIGGAWRATRGHFWSLLGAYAVIMLGFLLFEIVALALISPAYLKAMFGGMQPQEMAAALQAQLETMANGPTLGMAVKMLLGITAGTGFFAYCFAVVATAALDLSEAPPSPPTFGLPPTDA